MNRTARQQAAAKAATMTARLSDEALAQAWMVTEIAPITNESAMVRGWMMDETAAGSTPDPITYLTRAKN